MKQPEKIPIKKLEQKSVCEEVEEFLQKDRGNAYHVGGIMINAFDVKQKEINGSFKTWKKGKATLYSRIRNCLERLVKEGKVNKRRQGRADYYWAAVNPDLIGRKSVI